MANFKIIEKYLEQKGWTMSKFTESIGMSRQAVTRTITYNSTITKTAEKIAAGLDISVCEFFMEKPLVEVIAKAAYEVNRAYCQTIDDNSHLPWDELPPDQKERTIENVTFILAYPDVKPEELFVDWIEGSLEGDDVYPRFIDIKYAIFIAVVRNFTLN